MHSLRRFTFLSLIAAFVGPFAVAAVSSPDSPTDDALLAQLAQADGRTVDAHGNLIPAPLDRTTVAQTVGPRTIATPAGMRFVPADVTLGTPEFFAGIYEVTQAEYSAFLAANPSAALPLGWTSRSGPRGLENFPVTGIARSDVLAYCAWIAAHTGRAVSLPTTAQATAFARGAMPLATRPPTTLHAVGADPRDVSAVGCFDVRGNAAEWRLDQADAPADVHTGFRLVAVVDAAAVSVHTISALESAPTNQPVTVLAYIDITKQPASQPVALGGNFTLSVRASMQFPEGGRLNADQFELSLQWFKDDLPIDGASSSTYSVSAMRESDAGIYRVRITNAATGIIAYSDPAVIDLGLTGTAPRFTRIPSEVAVASGGTASISFDFEAPTRHALSWMMMSTSLTSAPPAVPDVQITESPTSSTATWRNAARDSGLTFTLRVFSAYGTTEASTIVTVINDGAAPAFTRHPTAITTARGSSVTMEATATGTPAPTYQWLRNGTAITGATASSLTLANVQDADTGSYSVTATNVLGRTTSNTANLALSTLTPATSSGGGGGGAPSSWFALCATAILLLRRKGK